MRFGLFGKEVVLQFGSWVSFCFFDGERMGGVCNFELEGPELPFGFALLVDAVDFADVL